jgi:hypothetical protein
MLVERTRSAASDGVHPAAAPARDGASEYWARSILYQPSVI